MYLMHYSFDPITISITSITIAITSIKYITASILKQCALPSPSRLSHALQLQSYNNVHHHRHHVYHMHYSFNPLTMSIPIAIASITFITASILEQCPPLQSSSPSRLSLALQLQSHDNKYHFLHHRHHVYHIH